MISTPVTIVNKLGLHARAASRLVNCASAFSSDIQIIKGTRSDAKATNSSVTSM